MSLLFWGSRIGLRAKAAVTQIPESGQSNHRRVPVSNVNVSIYAQLDIDLPSKTGKLEKRTPSTRGVTGDAGTAPERLVPSDGATGWERG